MSSMSSSATTSMMPRSIQVPSEIVRKWQEVVDVLALLRYNTKTPATLLGLRAARKPVIGHAAHHRRF
jgi:hypothetical protein